MMRGVGRAAAGSVRRGERAVVRTRASVLAGLIFVCAAGGVPTMAGEATVHESAVRVRAVREMAAAPRAQKPDVNPRAAVVSGFMERVKQYLALRKKAASAVSPHSETNDPAAIIAREHALAEAIRRARPGAKPGDVFGPEMSALILDIVRKDWNARPHADRVAMFEDLPKPFMPRVNMSWPTGYPFATFPASMLAQLQDLPDELEYRFVGRHLVLRDVEANMIVDVIHNVLPS